MKRTHSDVQKSFLPSLGSDDPRKLKSILESFYELRIIKAVDISKPTARPVDEVDEPENEDEARENKLNQNNARMLQLTLRDINDTEICAIETERIPELDNVKVNWKVYIEGPVEVRCGNMMLEKKNVVGKEAPLESQAQPIAMDSTDQNVSPSKITDSITVVNLDNHNSNVLQPNSTLPLTANLQRSNITAPEDWDDLDEDEDDCIILD